MAKVNDLRSIALQLYDAGFNVVPVDRNKRPLTSWSATKRIPREELEKALERASGIAIVAGPENPSKVYDLLIVDIDDVYFFIDKTQLLKRLVLDTVHWTTGPRCPWCGGKDLEVLEPGMRFKCRKCGRDFDAEEAKYGLGAMFWISPEVKEKYLKGTKRGPIEFLVNNYQLIPPSLHPTGVRYEWIIPLDLSKPGFGIYALVEEEVKSILKELGILKDGTEEKTEEGGEKTETKTESKAESKGELRELSDSDLLKLVELLKEAYRPGRRQFIVLYLAGWLANARVHPLSVVKLVKMLHEKTNDEDSLKTRLGAVVYTYKKAGINIDNWANEIEQLTGVKPYGIEREIREGEIKGKSGLQEILEEVLGEERALAIISKIEEILGVPSPYRDSILGIMDYEKEIYAIANLRKLIMARVRKVNDKMIYKEKVANVAPTKVVVYENPIDVIKKYQITFEGQVLRRPLVIGPATLDEIADRLKVEGGIVVHSRLLYDVLNTIVGVYIKTGRAEVRTEIEKPGFYIIDGKLLVVGYDYNNLDKERLRQALELLNDLANNWFKHVQDRFALIVKWGAIAPFSYIIKQRGKFVKWLFLFGDSATGKTTLGRIVLKMWGLEPRFEKTGASVDTVARLGQVLSQGTFPVLINEPGSALSKEDIVDTIKNAVDNTVARSKYVKGTYVDFPALAPLIFTSNRNLPNDDALARRLYIITFSFAEKIPVEKQREFKEKVEPRLSLLAEVGKCIAGLVSENQQYLNLEPLEAGKEVLVECYKKAGLEPLEWLNLTYEGSSEGIYDEIIELVRDFLRRRINEEYNRGIGKLIAIKPGDKEDEEIYDYRPKEDADFAERVKTVLNKDLLPWAILRNGYVYITVGLAKELQGMTGTVASLKSLAELLGWDYVVARIQGKNTKCIKVSLEKFIEFLNPSVEE